MTKTCGIQFVLLLLAAVVLTSQPVAAAAPASLVQYTLHVDPSDLAGVDVEMQFIAGRGPVRIAMAAHPESDEKYYLYIKNVTATSVGSPITVVREQKLAWRTRGASGDVLVKSGLRFPPQVRAVRDA